MAGFEAEFPGEKPRYVNVLKCSTKMDPNRDSAELLSEIEWMKMPNAAYKSVGLCIFVLLALLVLTACGTLEIGIERTASPDLAPETTSVPVPTPVAPLPGMVYQTTEGLWWASFDGPPRPIFDRLDAHLSPDGTRALYLEKDAGDLDLWLTDLITGERRNLTETPDRAERQFRWWPARPDVVLFSSLPQEIEPAPGMTGFLAAVGVDGSDYRVLDEQNHVGGPPAPSPDGQTVAYGTGPVGWLYRWDTGTEPFDPAAYGLTGVSDLHIGNPSWSPNGTKLAWMVGGTFALESGFQMGVGVFDLDSQTVQLLHLHQPVGGDGWPEAPAWSPDGKWLAFDSWDQDSDKAGVWVVPSDGQSQEAHHLGGHSPVWSPDGRWLAYRRAPQSGEAYYSLAWVETWTFLQLDLPPDAYVVDWLTEDDGRLATPEPVETDLPISAPTPTPFMDMWTTYVNPLYVISMEYPADWEPVPGYVGPDSVAIKFAAINGFFHINAIDAPTIDDAAIGEAEHQLRPYGSQPIIESLQVQGQEARLILPSEDQPVGMDHQAALIVRYPDPVNISGSTYHFFVLWADKSHIRTFAQTLRFTAGSAPSATDTPAPPLTWENLPPGLVYSASDGLWWIDSDEQPVLLHNDPQAVLSPDGSKVLAYDALQQDLWLLDLNQGTIWKLTRTPDRTECCFQWWPERPDMVLFNSVAEAAERGPGLMGFLSAIATDGQAYQILDPEHDTGPGEFAPSPDGETIAYGGGSTGWLYRWAGPEPFDPADYGLVVRDGVQIAQPAWSPDGSRLAWIVKGNLGADGGPRVGVGVFDLEARTVRVLHPYEPQGVGWPPVPLWSPDGKWLAFSDSSASDQAGLWVARTEGLWEEVHLGLGGNPVWSPDGEWLGFQSASQDGPLVYMFAKAATWERRPLNIPVDRYGKLVDWIDASGTR